MIIQLDNAQRQAIFTELKQYGLEDYTPNLELIILGQSDGDHIIRLIRVFCQTAYLKGKRDSQASFNHAIKKV